MKAEKLSKRRVEQIKRQFRSIPYVKFIGIELERIEYGMAELSLDVVDALKRNNGIAHGGAIASLIDTATAFASLSVISAAQRTTTIDLTISFLKPLIDGKAIAVARIVRSGRRIAVVSADVYGHDGTLAATALSTYIKD